MRDKFLCGHLVLYKDGTVKQLIANGPRVCNITRYDMTWGEIHDRLRELFLENDTSRESRLYDFNCKEFDTNQYVNFYDYVEKRGYTFRRKLLYLCTLADDRISFDSPGIQTTSSTSASVTRSIHQVETTSPASLNENKHKDKPLSSTESSVNNHQFKNLQIFSYSNYSFARSLNELYNYVQDLFHQYRHEKKLNELSEHIFALRFLSLPILDQIKQQNQDQKFDYNNDLEKIKNLSQSIKEFIESNKIIISNIDPHSIIMNSFNQFSEHFHTLRDRWMNERNTPAIKSSPRGDSNRYSQKRTQSPSSNQTTAGNNDSGDNGYSLFKDLLKSLDYLLKILRERGLVQCIKVVKDSITDVEYHRLNIRLSDYQSLSTAKNSIISIRNRLSEQVVREDDYGRSYKTPAAYDRVSDSIKAVLNSIENYQSKINNSKRSRPTPTKPQSIIHESIQLKTRIDDDQSSDASHSTIADEDLKKEAFISF